MLLMKSHSPNKYIYRTLILFCDDKWNKGKLKGCNVEKSKVEIDEIIITYLVGKKIIVINSNGEIMMKT